VRSSAESNGIGAVVKYSSPMREMRKIPRVRARRERERERES
jgi:hypothetical protein